MNAALSRRLVRRESFKSRSLAVSIALGVLIVGLAYLGTEAVLEAIGATPLLNSFSATTAAVLGTDNLIWMLPAAAGAVIIGLVLIIVALTPGSRRRHRLDSDRVAILVDDDVLAGAVSRQAAATAGIARDQVSTTVSARAARVTVRPSSGFPVVSSEVQQSTNELVSALSPKPAVRVNVAVASHGVVGA